ncbi:hypothetical protein Pla108_32840 [Botrimarina colliarenosi]|uniref:Uncharacterized protein n=1 Tax=Botrimarina colliarenosi TaxID=2528001 RepID=A0A5C6A9T0_9BACT|nr:hypothetical protein [Botrimarina colliarenosi]TWT96196.1 hypothetical protein Pla108_32840 [Botrimarina colliarenosi]
MPKLSTTATPNSLDHCCVLHIGFLVDVVNCYSDILTRVAPTVVSEPLTSGGAFDPLRCHD